MDSIDMMLDLCAAQIDLDNATKGLEQIERYGAKVSEAGRDIAHASVARLTKVVAELEAAFIAAKATEDAAAVAEAEAIVATVPVLTATADAAHSPRVNTPATKRSGMCFLCRVNAPTIGMGEDELMLCAGCAFVQCQRPDFGTWEPEMRTAMISGLNALCAPLATSYTWRDVSRPAPMETPAQRVTRLARKAMAEGIEVTRDARGTVYASSGTKPNVRYAIDLDAQTCTCAGFEATGGCKHLALATSELGSRVAVAA